MRRQSLDTTDIAIISHLQQDGRRAFTTIAKELGISEASVRQRVSRLLRTNVIQIVAVSSPLDLGLIWGQVQLRVAGDRLEAVAELAELPQVDFVSICAGDYDIIVGVVAHDREELLDVLVNHIRTIPGIDQAEFLLQLRVLKDNYEWSPGEHPATVRRRDHGRQTRPNVHTPPPGPRSAALMKRADDILLGVSLIGGWPPSHFVARTATAGSSRTWTATATSTGSTAGRARRWAAITPSSSRPRAGPQGVRHRVPLGAAGGTSGSSPRSCTPCAPPPLTKVVYDTTGSEVVENAVRIMREAAGPGRPFVITFLGSFHGGNYGTGAMGPHNAHYNHAIEPFMSGWINVPFPTCYRCPYHLEHPACDLACLDYIEEMIIKYKATPDSIAGVNVEFIQGENGVQIPPPSGPSACTTSAGSTTGSSTTTRYRRAWDAPASGSRSSTTPASRPSC